ncbi:MAG: Re/Si-specific NAD(P)(+) transhydrogenase subunit alpha [Gammaproteobacteria bacterium]
MPLKLAIPRETSTGERRVAVDALIAGKLSGLGLEVLLETGAGDAARMPDDSYTDVTVVKDAAGLYAQADIVVKIQPPTEDEIAQMKEGAVLIGTLLPHRHPELVAKLRDRKITSFAMELIPRISRAQSMDVLSSQAAVAGYKAAIMGADLASRFFPMLTTAAGTIRPSKVIVLGAGVAGLQAIATARRLGAMVEAYDVRSATKEQVESLGAKFIELDIKAEGEGGYARELTDEEKQKQQEQLAGFVAQADVLITTAAVPGRPSPKLVPEAMVQGMKPGSVIIDLAAEGGGNCVFTVPGETIEKHGVVVHGPLNVPSQVPFHASEMYAKNVFNFLSPMIQEGQFTPNWEDEIQAQSVLTHEGAIKHEPTRKLVEGEAS